MTNAVAPPERAFSFTLPSDSRVASTEATWAAIQSGLASASGLSLLGDVQEADAATIQLLLLLERELKCRGESFELTSPSAALQTAIGVAGAQQLLPSN
jgi:hypothetical protein